MLIETATCVSSLCNADWYIFFPSLLGSSIQREQKGKERKKKGKVERKSRRHTRTTTNNNNKKKWRWWWWVVPLDAYTRTFEYNVLLYTTSACVFCQHLGLCDDSNITTSYPLRAAPPGWLGAILYNTLTTIIRRWRWQWRVLCRRSESKACVLFAVGSSD